MNTASTYRRFYAKIIDQILVSIFWLPVLIQLGFSYFSKSLFIIEWKWLILSFVLQFSYKVFFLKFLSATPGKLIMGLKLVSQSGSELSWLQIILRVLADHLSVFFGWGLYSLAFLRFDRTHVSDWVAETRVIQKASREEPVRRRPLLALLLFLYFSISQFSSVYTMLQRVSWDRQSVVIDAFAKENI